MLIRVASSPKLLVRSPGTPCNDWKMYDRKCWLSQPQQWKISMSHHHEWQITASLVFSSLKIGRLTFTLRHLPALLLSYSLEPPHHGWLMRTPFTSPIRTHTHSVSWLLTSPFLTSTLEASSSKPCILSSMWYAAAGVWFVFIVPWGVAWPHSLSSLFHDTICNGLTTFLNSAHHHFHPSLSSSPINLASQAESNILCITKRKLLF